MQSRRARRFDERGETLIELIVSLAILGVAGVAIMTGLMVSVKSSDQHRDQATGGAYVRSFAEAIQQSVDDNAGYATCGNAIATYALVAVPDFDTAGFAADDFTKSVLSVRSWNGTSWGACIDGRAQQLVLRVRSDGVAARQVDESLVVVLRKPCNGALVLTGEGPCA